MAKFASRGAVIAGPILSGVLAFSNAPKNSDQMNAAKAQEDSTRALIVDANKSVATYSSDVNNFISGSPDRVKFEQALKMVGTGA